MVALLPVVLVLGLACSRRDLARLRSTASHRTCDRGPKPSSSWSASSSSASSPVKAKDANSSCAAVSTVELGEGTALGWLFRGGGRHGNSLAEGARVQSVVTAPGPQEKEELHQYSVALARTQLLRRERDRAIKEATSPLAHMYLTVTRAGQHNRWMSSPLISTEARHAQRRYLLEAGKIIRSTGLTTARYNELSQIVGKRKDLRDHVWRQARLYRTRGAFAAPRLPPGGDEVVESESRAHIPFAAAAAAADDVEGEMKPAKLRLEHRQRRRHRHSRQGTGSRRGGRNGSKGRRVAREENLKPHTDKQTTMRFAKSLREIEALRLRQRGRLMTDIGCGELPKGLCRPSMGRVASPRVRKECQKFPAQAESIVKANGLKPEVFNRLSERSRSNLFYRWLVCRCVRQLEKGHGRQTRRR